MLDDRLLEAYMDGFYGYGDYSGKSWLVGMEEGGGNTESEIGLRLAAWVEGGRRELDDVVAFHRRTNLGKWFEPNPPLQSTWSPLIRMLLAVDGQTPSKDAIKAFQGGRLGRTNGDNCIIELLPLPSPGRDRWSYDQWSGLPQLRNRREYETALKESRSRHIWERIQEHRPELVVFYSFGDMPAWTAVSGCTFTLEGGVHLAKRDGTLFVVTRHPVAWGPTNAYFDSVGTRIRGLLNR